MDTSRECCARIGIRMPAHAYRKGARCGAITSTSHVATIRGKLVTLPLCRIHLRVLLKSNVPTERARSWGPTTFDADDASHYAARPRRLGRGPAGRSGNALLEA